MNKLFLMLLRRPEGESAAADGGGDPPAAPVAEAPAPAEPEVEQEVPAAPQPVLIPASVMQRRVDTLTRQKADLQRQIEMLRLEQSGNAPQKPTPAVPSTEVLDTAVSLAQQMDFDRRANAIAEAGSQIAEDFRMQIQQMNALHGILPTPFLQAVMEVGDSPQGSAEILYALSKDAAKAAEILALSPIKQAAALVKLQSEMAGKKAKPAVKAPEKPVPTAGDPIPAKVGSGAAPKASTDLYSPKTPIDDWMAQREAEVKARARRY